MGGSGAGGQVAGPVQATVQAGPLRPAVSPWASWAAHCPLGPRSLDELHPPPSSRCRGGEPAGLAVPGRGQEEQSPILVPDPGLLHPRLLLPGPQPAGEWSRSSRVRAQVAVVPLRLGEPEFPGCVPAGGARVPDPAVHLRSDRAGQVFLLL